MKYRDATVLAQGSCTWIRSDGLITSTRFEQNGLTLHWFKGSERCAPRCPGCEQDAPEGTWVTRDPRTMLRLGDIRLFQSKAPAAPPIDPSRAIDAQIKIPLPPGLELRPYQRAAVAYASKRKNVLIGDEMGVGKTIEAIALVNYLRSPLRILVVCPATIKENWRREIEAWDAQDAPAVVCDHAFDVPEDTMPMRRVWCITNPDRLLSVKTRAGETSERAGGLWDVLMRISWDVLILDEAHRFKNVAAARTPRVLGQRKTRKLPQQDGLVQRSKVVVALTGTPIPNRVRELWPIVSVLAPEVFRREGDFLFRYCGPFEQNVYTRGCKGKAVKVWNFDGSSNLAELQEKLRLSCMIRRLKTDVLSELPAKTRQVLPLPLDRFQEAADAERVGWLRLVPNIKNIRAEALMAEALEDAFAFDAALEKLDANLDKIDVSKIAAERQAFGLAKVPLVVEHVSDCLEAPAQKVVVMAHHREVIRRLVDGFTTAGFGTVSLYGDTPMAARQGAVDAFQTDPSIRVLVGGLHAAGVGITLTAANLMIFAEADWQPGVLAQCDDRIHRIGQDRGVMIQYLVVDGSIEALVLASALRKQRIADKALDSPPSIRKRRTDWPKASEVDHKVCAEVLAFWMSDVDLGKNTLRERTMVLVTSLENRLRNRRLTDGEIWLCKKIVRENLNSLPPRLRAL